MSDGLEGKCLLVTGGSRGIGRAIVLAAVERRAKVAFCARALGEDSDATVAEAERIGGKGCALAVAADCSVEADVERFVDAALERFKSIDAIIHNAGINRDALLVQSTLASFNEVLSANLTGGFLLSRRAVQEFLSTGTAGRIVFIGSVSDQGLTAQTAYAASKGGLHGLARTLAKEYGHRLIATNTVVVGLVDTQMTAHLPDRFRKMALDNPMRRTGLPSEVASVALFLASPRATFINGETLYASGGLQELNG